MGNTNRQVNVINTEGEISELAGYNYLRKDLGFSWDHENEIEVDEDGIESP